MRVGDRELRLERPVEGWTTVALVAFMGLVVAWAVDDPAWVNGRGALTDCLGVFALGGALVGLLGPKVGWGRWTTHLVGALFAALVVPIYAGWAMVPGSSPAAAFAFTASGTVEAYLDLAWRNMLLTPQEVHYIVVIGGIVWASMQFASYAVFGHRRPLAAIVIVGLLLVANMAATSRDQLMYLIAYTGAALLLLIQMHAFDERTTWMRRRIGDPSQLSSLYLRGGALFIIGAMTASLLLTVRASSAPLAGAWDGINDQLVRIGEDLSRLFPVGGDFRGGGGVSFSSTAQIRTHWFVDDAVAFTADVPPETKGERWRAATYDTFNLRAWTQTAITSVPVAPGDPLLAGTPENPDQDLTTAATVTVHLDDFADHILLAPGTPTATDKSANVLLTGQDGWFGGVDMPGSPDDYQVAVAVLKPFSEDTITGNELAAAGTDYPQDVVDRYTAIPNDAIGPAARKLLADMLASAPASDPYTLAVTFQNYLRDDTRFKYQTDISGVANDSASAVEFFAETKTGYCLHYASTMAILLRAADPAHPIPTRLVQGFLPGTRKGTTEEVVNKNAHAWVEVYFPGYGWIPFDPTGGGIGRPSVIPAGPEVTPAPSGPRKSLEPDQPDPTRRINGPLPSGGPATPTSGGGLDRTLAIVLTVLLASVIAAVAVAAWVRGPRGEVSPEAAWRSLSRTASRFGFAPRPTQTIYEYASSLGDLVPVARDDLQVVADARVETTYARVRLGGARLDAVRDATRRLRITLLRLVLRRSQRPGGRRRRR